MKTSELYQDKIMLLKKEILTTIYDKVSKMCGVENEYHFDTMQSVAYVNSPFGCKFDTMSVDENDLIVYLFIKEKEEQFTENKVAYIRCVYNIADSFKNLLYLLEFLEGLEDNGL